MTRHPIHILRKLRRYDLLIEAAPDGQPFANRQPWPLNADTADFSDEGDRILLARHGVFSIDATAHREKRQRERDRRMTLEIAYSAIGLDRDAEHKRIAAEMEATRFDGIWARSTGEYSRACAQLDRDVLSRVHHSERNAA